MLFDSYNNPKKTKQNKKTINCIFLGEKRKAQIS